MKWSQIGVLALGVVMSTTVLARGLTFSSVKLREYPPIDMSSVERKSLEEAEKLHQLMLDINQLKGMDQQQKYAVKFKQAEQKKMAAFENCAMKRLKKSSKDPQKKWNDMKEKYNRGEENQEMEDYGLRKQRLDSGIEFEQQMKGKIVQTGALLKEKASQFVQIEANEDLSNTVARQNVMARLKAKYEKLLSEAETELMKRDAKTDGEYDKDAALLAALKKDVDGTVFFNSNNAGDFDTLKEQSQMYEKISSHNNQFEKMLDRELKSDWACVEDEN